MALSDGHARYRTAPPAVRGWAVLSPGREGAVRLRGPATDAGAAECEVPPPAAYRSSQRRPVAHADANGEVGRLAATLPPPCVRGDQPRGRPPRRHPPEPRRDRRIAAREAARQ